jgi:hypothetical protein
MRRRTIVAVQQAIPVELLNDLDFRISKIFFQFWRTMLQAFAPSLIITGLQ